MLRHMKVIPEKKESKRHYVVVTVPLIQWIYLDSNLSKPEKNIQSIMKNVPTAGICYNFNVLISIYLQNLDWHHCILVFMESALSLKQKEHIKITNKQTVPFLP